MSSGWSKSSASSSPVSFRRLLSAKDSLRTENKIFFNKEKLKKKLQTGDFITYYYDWVSILSLYRNHHASYTDTPRWFHNTNKFQEKFTNLMFENKLLFIQLHIIVINRNH